jgi:phosphoglycolate phosphatase
MSGQHKNEMLSDIKIKYALKKPVYIGDTEGDEAACKIANIDFIHVTYGFGSSKKNIVNFDSFNSLVAYFEG